MKNKLFKEMNNEKLMGTDGDVICYVVASVAVDGVLLSLIHI